MSDTEMDPMSSLAGYLRESSPEQAVKLARELCGQLEGEPESFHGGIWPGNVTLDVDGTAVLGKPSSVPARNRPANQVEYTSPEFFWDGDRSAAADVYAVALMLYAGCQEGYLPFQPHVPDLAAKDRAEALRRRMKGQRVTAPDNVSEQLKKVLEKALSFDPEGRYITAREFLSALNTVPEAAEKADIAAPLGAMAAAAAAAAAEMGPGPEPEDELPAPEPEVDPEEFLRAEIAREAEDAAATALAAAVLADERAKAELEAASESDTAPESDAASGGDTAPESDAAPGPEAAPETDAAPEAGAEPVPEAAAEPDTSSETEEGASALGSDTSVPPAQTPPEPVIETASMSTADGEAAAKRDYKVQKNFERTRAPRPEPVKRRRSLAAPILCGLAAVLIIGGVGWVLFNGGSQPELSSPFSTQEPPPPTEEGPTPTPLVITPAPTKTPAPTRTPAPTPDASLPSPTPISPVAPLYGADGGNGGGTATNLGAGGSGNSGGTSGGGTSGGSSYGGGASGSGTSGTGSSGSSGSSGFTVSPASGTVYLTGDQVRVRSGPGIGYSILGSLNKGDPIARTGTVANGWTQVTYGGRTGYISSQYLTDTTPATPEPTPGVPVTPGPTPVPAPVYSVSKQDLTYAEAKEAAAANGGLATAPDEAAFNALTDALRGNAEGLEFAWLGAEYDAENGAWYWSDGSLLPLGDPHWADGYPVQGHDVVMLSLVDNEWKFVSLSSAEFDPASDAYAGKLGYVTAG